ncbi:MAG: hypothetical protein U5N86_01730 [Planctomycetota bacterium]|nr:hypothetical protein [Planctomycetota bacterium]
MAELKLCGDYRKVMNCALDKRDVSEFEPGAATWGIGLAAPGSVEKTVFGESITFGEYTAIEPAIKGENAHVHHGKLAPAFYLKWDMNGADSYFSAPSKNWDLQIILQQIYIELIRSYDSASVYAFALGAVANHVDSQVLVTEPFCKERAGTTASPC